MTNGLNNKTSRKDMEYFITRAIAVISYVWFVRKDRNPGDNAETHFNYKRHLKLKQWKNQHQS
jgi:hypothetical protein